MAETTGTSGTTAPPEENEPPTVALKANPEKLTQAGKALLLLDVSADVVKVRLAMDGRVHHP